jgi:pyruvate-formate lyase-activating enzyme
MEAALGVYCRDKTFSEGRYWFPEERRELVWCFSYKASAQRTLRNIERAGISGVTCELKHLLPPDLIFEENARC